MVNKLEDNNVVNDASGESFYQNRPTAKIMIDSLPCEAKMDEHSDVYSRRGVSLIMLLRPVVINRPVGGVIGVRSYSYANCTAKQAHCGQFNAD